MLKSTTRPNTKTTEQEISKLEFEVSLLERRIQNPFLNKVLTQKPHDRVIFVSIPSYRDPQCCHTLFDLFLKAAFPKRVYVGICQQVVADKDADCMSLFHNLPSERRILKSNVFVLTMDATQAKGPMYARSLIETKLFRKVPVSVDYYMTIDSHMVFTDNWDIKCISMLHQCDSAKPVLTCYPPEYDLRKNITEQFQKAKPSFLTFKRFHPQLKLPEQQKKQYTNIPVKPLKSLFYASGFAFTLASVVEQVPYDPNCPYLFIGEEINMAARLFTNGYDLYNPNTVLLLHVSDRNYRPTFWENFYQSYSNKSDIKTSEVQRKERKQLEQQSSERVRSLLSSDSTTSQWTHSDFDKYGLGKQRSLEEFQIYCGLMFEEGLYHAKSMSGIADETNDYEMSCKLGKR